MDIETLFNFCSEHGLMAPAAPAPAPDVCVPAAPPLTAAELDSVYGLIAADPGALQRCTDPTMSVARLVAGAADRSSGISVTPEGGP